MTVAVSPNPPKQSRQGAPAKPEAAAMTNREAPVPEQAPLSPQFRSIDALPERIRVIATLRGLGYTFREIGEQLNVTPQAVSLMLSRHRRALVKLKGAFDFAKLSARAVNVLGRHGIRSRLEANDPDFLLALQRERNCGRKTREEIERWIAEMDEDARGQGVPVPRETPSAIPPHLPEGSRRHAESAPVDACRN